MSELLFYFVFSLTLIDTTKFLARCGENCKRKMKKRKSGRLCHVSHVSRGGSLPENRKSRGTPPIYVRNPIINPPYVSYIYDITMFFGF